MTLCKIAACRRCADRAGVGGSALRFLYPCRPDPVDPSDHGNVRARSSSVSSATAPLERVPMSPGGGVGGSGGRRGQAADHASQPGRRPGVVAGVSSSEAGGGSRPLPGWWSPGGDELVDTCSWIDWAMVLDNERFVITTPDRDSRPRPRARCQDRPVLHLRPEHQDRHRGRRPDGPGHPYRAFRQPVQAAQVRPATSTTFPTPGGGATTASRRHAWRPTWSAGGSPAWSRRPWSRASARS